jgi:hypothetical protein
VAFRRFDGTPRDPLLVDGLTARILMLSDGTRTAAEIAAELTANEGISVVASHLGWVENLFVQGLISLEERLVPDCDPAGVRRPRAPTPAQSQPGA